MALMLMGFEVDIEYTSADDARAVLGQLREAGVFEPFRPMFGPSITEVAEETTY